MPGNQNKKSVTSNRLLIVIFLVLAILVVSGVNWRHLTNLFTDSGIIQEEKAQKAGQSPKAENDEKQLVENLGELPESGTWQTKLDEQPPSIDFRKTPCAELDRLIQEFFLQLEGRDYLANYHLQGEVQNHLKKLVDKLIANPPIVARETDSLFTILTNTAHFYRVLGKADLFLIKEILLREGDSLEYLLALFNHWPLVAQQCDDPQTQIDLPLQGLYEYAGFFLNTLGGQGYLYRRDSRLRLLIKYYCVQVLDRANAQIANRHGIDIAPHLEALTSEMELSEALLYKEHYLRTLRGLQEKYQAYYQPPNPVDRTLNR